MIDLYAALSSRLHYMEHCAKQGIIPGQLDSIELEQMAGRIKGLKYIIQVLEENNITGAVTKYISEQV